MLFFSARRGCSRQKILLQLLTAVLPLLAAVISFSTSVRAEPAKNFTFVDVVALARTRAEKSFKEASTAGSSDLTRLSYDEYRMIRPNPKAALWKDASLFQTQFFHPGFLFNIPVTVTEVNAGIVRTIPFSDSLFEFDKTIQPKLAGKKVRDFAGVKFTYPLHRADVHDDVLVFLGASYFRLVGRHDQFGISARALAIDTAEPRGEEFPYFVEFWLLKPEAKDTTLTVFALLDSKSVSGAYQFIVNPGQETSLDCSAHLFFRDKTRKFGIAPLTSMFLHGENGRRSQNDFRPEVHDSDGLLIHTSGSNNWLFRPLANPKSGFRVSRFEDASPEGFGLVQRDRRYENYLDLETHFENRPDLWVEPRGAWGNGSIELVEIATEFETNDNIVAYWVPNELRENELTLAYRLTAGRLVVDHKLGKAIRTMLQEQKRNPEEDKAKENKRFIVDFAGGELKDIDGNQPLNAELVLSQGSFRELIVEKDEQTGHWRVSFLASREAGTAVDISLSINLHGERLSETWSYLWDDSL